MVVRIGIIGCGSFIQRRILTALRDIPAIKVVAIQKRNLEAAHPIQEKFHIPRAYTTRDELLADPDVEAVIIGSINQNHEEDALACAAAQKPTLCEKPLAPTAEAVSRMLQAFGTTPFLVGHQMRFKPCVQRARQMIKEKSLGVVRMLHARFCLTNTALNSWKFAKEAGGGVLNDLGCHLIDLIRFISGEKIVSVFAQANPEFSPDGQAVERSVQAIFRLQSGISASILCSLEQPYQTGFEVIGSKGRLVSTQSLRQTYDPIERLCHIKEDEDTRLFFPIKATNSYVEELKHFAAVVRSQEEPIIPATEGLINQQIIEACLDSITTQKAIHL